MKKRWNGLCLCLAAFSIVAQFVILLIRGIPRFVADDIALFSDGGFSAWAWAWFCAALLLPIAVHSYRPKWEAAD